MSRLYIGRAVGGNVEMRRYPDGVRPPAGFRTPTELVQRSEELARREAATAPPDFMRDFLGGFYGR